MKRFNKHIIIVGSARSGTSWLAETIAIQYRYRLLFEPEQETQTKDGHLLCDKWFTNIHESPQAYKYLTRVFQNRVDSDWIAQNSNRSLKRHLWPFIPKKYNIKFVRANLLAKYMNKNFQIPIIHIIRNPYDVIYSQQKVKFPWLYDLSHFADQNQLVELIKNSFSFDISTYKSLSDIETLCLRWCIENVIPLEVFGSYSEYVTIVKYEDLFSEMEVFYTLCRKFDLEPIHNLDKYYKRPSTKTHPNSSVHAGNMESNSWTKDGLIQINKILDIFNTSLYPRKN